MVTAYDAPAALLADQSGVELILVGDTAAMVMLGHESTVPVTLDEMIFLTRAVTRAARRPLVVGDLPFGTYEVSDEQAVASAIRLVKEGGADVVKLEGAGRMLGRVRAIAESNIGVMGHVGLTPQSATKLGGFRAQGRTTAAALKLYDDALALQEAGAFAVVLEAVPAQVAARISNALEIPTIGIGAGAATDGQVLVWHDLLGIYPGRTPRFVKKYAEVADEIRGALERYVADVRSGAFPEERHTYAIGDDELARFEDATTER
jgi:3-methyl-2-oxobutanoate hydroxymethyltransferase